MAKQGKTSFEKADKPGEKKNDLEQQGKRDNTETPDKNLDPESEFAVNELREEQRNTH